MADATHDSAEIHDRPAPLLFSTIKCDVHAPNEVLAFLGREICRAQRGDFTPVEVRLSPALLIV